MTHSTVQGTDSTVSHYLIPIQMITDPDVKMDSPVRPGASVGHAPSCFCSYCPCWLECLNNLTHEDPEANTHMYREKEEQQEMNESTGDTATTVVLQWEQCFP